MKKFLILPLLAALAVAWSTPTLVTETYAYYAPYVKGTGSGGAVGYQVFRITRYDDGITAYQQIEPATILKTEPTNKDARKTLAAARQSLERCTEKHTAFHIVKRVGGSIKPVKYSVFCDPAKGGCGDFYDALDVYGKTLYTIVPTLGTNFVTPTNIVSGVIAPLKPAAPLKVYHGFHP